MEQLILGRMRIACCWHGESHLAQKEVSRRGKSENNGVGKI